MKDKYKQLTLADRTKIETLYELGFSARGIAKQLGRSNKSISNELSCYAGKQYNEHIAQSQSDSRRSKAKKHTK